MGEVAFERCRLLSMIGQGRMGKAAKAHETVIGRDAVIKVLSTEPGTEPGNRPWFRRKAHAANRLAEPHLIPITVHLIEQLSAVHDRALAAVICQDPPRILQAARYSL